MSASLKTIEAWGDQRPVEQYALNYSCPHCRNFSYHRKTGARLCGEENWFIAVCGWTPTTIPGDAQGHVCLLCPSCFKRFGLLLNPGNVVAYKERVPLWPISKGVQAKPIPTPSPQLALAL